MNERFLGIEASFRFWRSLAVGRSFLGFAVAADNFPPRSPGSVALRNLDIWGQRDPLQTRKPRKCPSLRIFLHYASRSFQQLTDRTASSPSFQYLWSELCLQQIGKNRHCFLIAVS